MLQTFDTLLIYSVSYFALFVAVFFLLTFIESKEKLKSPKPKRFPKISVVIPAHNEERVIEKTIRSALAVDYPKNKLEIIVVDDGSTDRTFEIAKKFERKNIKVFKKKKGGKASALNFGLKKAKGELILALDADCFLSKDSLKKMVGYFEDPKVMSVVPALSVYKPRKFIEKMQVVEYAITAFVRKLTTFIHSLNLTPGAALYRKEFFEKYGGFDENNVTEDFEIGMRIQSKNFDIAYALDTIVKTIVPDNLKDLMKQRIRWTYGTLWNLKKYSFMFSLKYGDLGVFFLPVMALTMGLTTFLFIYYIVVSLWDFFDWLHLLSLIGFDWKYLLTNIEWEGLLNVFLSVRTFLFIALFSTGLITFIIAKKVLKKGKFKLEFLAYIFIYSWILLLFQCISVFYFILGKKPEWE